MGELPAVQDQQIITNRFRNEAINDVATSEWYTSELLHVPTENITFALVERDLPEPDAARGVREATWEEKVLERANVLSETQPNTSYVVREDTEGENATNLLALFEEKPDGQLRKVMWAGSTLTLAQQGVRQTNGGYTIPVYPISYTELIAAQNPKYKREFDKIHLQTPFAGIGISVIAETSDGVIPLTKRGKETAVYPGRFYSPGGGPIPGESPTNALSNELQEELGLTPGRDFDPQSIFALAMVTDRYFAGSLHARPELVSYLRLNIDFQTLQAIHDEHAASRGKQPDVWSIEGIPGSLPELTEYLRIINPQKFCPPTHAALIHTMIHKSIDSEGKDAASQRMQQMLGAY